VTILTASQIARSFAVAVAGGLIYAGVLYVMGRPPETLWWSTLGFGLATLVIRLVGLALERGRYARGKDLRSRSLLISIAVMAVLGAVLFVSAGLVNSQGTDVSLSAWAGVASLGGMIGGVIGGIFSVIMNAARHGSGRDFASPSA